MSVSLERLDDAALSELGITIRNAGVSGAGGAGFPTHAKWKRIEEVDALLVNHQESEPNYYIDKWLGREHARDFAALFDALLDDPLDLIVIGAKHTKRDPWLHDLELATDATVYRPDDLPIDPTEESGIVAAYTEDRYQFGMESVLLQQVADVVIGQDLPMDHGWIVQNTETLHRIYRTFERAEPMTRKLVHVDGRVPRHRFLDVPIGTPASTLLEAAGRSPDDLDGITLLDGGPGWCFEIDANPFEFGVRKRTNCLLVEETSRVEEHTLGDGRVNLLDIDDWADRSHETEPTPLDPDRVRIPLVSNPDFEGVVERSRPIVDEGESVDVGEMIAAPARGAISNAQHASIAGEVTEVTDTHVEISHRNGGGRALDLTETDRPVYWSWCVDCGDYIAMPDADQVVGNVRALCADCQ
ncbi:MAG: NADH dehydrogenase subunit [Halopenitus sp.]